MTFKQSMDISSYANGLTAVHDDSSEDEVSATPKKNKRAEEIYGTEEKYSWEYDDLQGGWIPYDNFSARLIEQV